MQIDTDSCIASVSHGTAMESGAGRAGTCSCLQNRTDAKCHNHSILDEGLNREGKDTLTESEARNRAIANVIDIVCDGHTRQEEGSHQYLVVGTFASVPPTAAGVTRLAQVRIRCICLVFLLPFCCVLGCLKQASGRFNA
jgi:hypothetical protein